MEKAETTNNFISTMKTRFHVDEFVSKIQQSKDYLIEMVLFAGVGFILGFFLKRFSTYVIAVVLTITALALLQHFEFITTIINWQRVHEFFGITPSLVAPEQATLVWWAWIKTHMILTVSFVIGFLAGLRCA